MRILNEEKIRLLKLLVVRDEDLNDRRRDVTNPEAWSKQFENF